MIPAISAYLQEFILWRNVMCIFATYTEIFGHPCSLNFNFTCIPIAFFQYRWQEGMEKYYRSTHLTPTIWTFSSLAHSMRWRQFFRVVPNFIVISSSPFMSSVAIWSKSLREGEDDWGTVGLQQHQHMWSLKTVRSMLIMMSLLQFCRRRVMWT